MGSSQMAAILQNKCRMTPYRFMVTIAWGRGACPKILNKYLVGCLVGPGQLWSALVGSRRVWSGLVRSGQVWSDLVGSGQIWSDLVGSGRV